MKIVTRKEKSDTSTPDMYTYGGKIMEEHSYQVAIYTPRSQEKADWEQL